MKKIVALCLIGMIGYLIAYSAASAHTRYVPEKFKTEHSVVKAEKKLIVVNRISRTVNVVIPVQVMDRLIVTKVPKPKFAYSNGRKRVTIEQADAYNFKNQKSTFRYKRFCARSNC